VTDNVADKHLEKMLNRMQWHWSIWPSKQASIDESWLFFHPLHNIMCSKGGRPLHMAQLQGRQLRAL